MLRLGIVEACDLLRRMLGLPRVYIKLVGRRSAGELSLGLLSDEDYRLFMDSRPQPNMLVGARKMRYLGAAELNLRYRLL